VWKNKKSFLFNPSPDNYFLSVSALHFLIISRASMIFLWEFIPENNQNILIMNKNKNSPLSIFNEKSGCC
jgi:hypothetical protein